MEATFRSARPSPTSRPTFSTSDGSRAPPGEEGELFVRGATVMHGYWGDPEKTAARLLPNPISHGETDLAYATGDLVVELESGDYRFIGRKDHQIKSRGYRIELGEIETALYAHPRCSNAPSWPFRTRSSPTGFGRTWW